MSSETHRILVVDDEPNIVDVVTMALRYQGFEVATAARAAAPVPADATAKPWKRRAIVITSTMFGSSSTTSTRGCGGCAMKSVSASFL